MMNHFTNTKTNTITYGEPYLTIGLPTRWVMKREHSVLSLNILASDSTKLRKVGRQLKPLFVYFFF